VRAAREQLAATGEWEPLHEDLLAQARDANDDPGAFRVDSEYLVALGTKRSGR
jgi:hypothetical protein